MQLLKDFIRDTVKQVCGFDLAAIPSRAGKIILTRRATQKMLQYRIDEKTLENAFRHGFEYTYGKISQTYPVYLIGLYYKEVEEKDGKRFVITTCWKGRWYNRKR
jgi:hypothetical protein